MFALFLLVSASKGEWGKSYHFVQNKCRGEDLISNAFDIAIVT